MSKFFFLPLLIGIACAVSKNSPNESQEQIMNVDWAVVHSQESFDDKVSFELKNISNVEIDVLNPLVLKISKKQGDEWKEVNYPYCPCMRSCPNPPDMFRINPDGEHNLSWDKTEITCEGKTEKRIDADKGTYKFTIRYRKVGINELKIFEYEFTI
jgi:hypothetical protein